jgi:enoyl-CoA hydratase/carnithine racemase
MTAEAFRSTVLDGAGAGEFGFFAGRPLCVVQLDDGPDIGPLAAFLPCVVAGVMAGPTGGIAVPDIDLLLTDDRSAGSPWVTCGDIASAVDGLDASCRASPLAAIALAQLLRLSGRLDVADGLAAESFVYSMLQAGPEHRAWLAGHPRRNNEAATEAAAAAATDPVTTRRHDDVLSISLDRPEVHNAYNAAMRDALAASLQVAALDPTVHRIVIDGAGPSFCSGGDLQEFGTATDPATAHAVRITRGAAIWMDRCADRITVRVHGACMGAGIELAGFARRVVADPASYFQLPEVAMGLIPGAGGTVSLPRRIGRQRTAYLAIGGEVLDAATALDWGLVDEAATADGDSPP